MYAVITPDQLHLPPGAVVRLLGSWQDYQQIRQQRGNTSIPRLKTICPIGCRKYGSGDQQS